MVEGGRGARTWTAISPPHDVVDRLRENYRIGESGALRKSFVYQHYLEACRETGLRGSPISHTYFGKLVRRAFAGTNPYPP